MEHSLFRSFAFTGFTIHQTLALGNTHLWVLLTAV
jgi:hypothetical protein